MMDNFLHHFAQKMRKDKVNGCKKEKVDTDRSTVFLLPNNVDVVPGVIRRVIFLGRLWTMRVAISSPSV